MGYSRSPHTVMAAEQWLEPLLSKKTVQWECADEATAEKLRYKIAEALVAARANAESFPGYAELAGKFRFRVRGNTLLAEWNPQKVNLQNAVATVGTAGGFDRSAIVTTWAGVVGVWNRMKDKIGDDYLRFDNCRLSREEMVQLVEHAAEAGFSIAYYDRPENKLGLIPRDERYDEYEETLFEQFDGPPSQPESSAPAASPFNILKQAYGPSTPFPEVNDDD